MKEHERNSPVDFWKKQGKKIKDRVEFNKEFGKRKNYWKRR